MVWSVKMARLATIGLLIVGCLLLLVWAVQNREEFAKADAAIDGAMNPPGYAITRTRLKDGAWTIGVYEVVLKDRTRCVVVHDTGADCDWD